MINDLTFLKSYKMEYSYFKIPKKLHVSIGYNYAGYLKKVVFDINKSKWTYYLGRKNEGVMSTKTLFNMKICKLEEHELLRQVYTKNIVNRGHYRNIFAIINMFVYKDICTFIICGFLLTG